MFIHCSFRTCGAWLLRNLLVVGHGNGQQAGRGQFSREIFPCPAQTVASIQYLSYYHKVQNTRSHPVCEIHMKSPVMIMASGQKTKHMVSNLDNTLPTRTKEY